MKLSLHSRPSLYSMIYPSPVWARGCKNMACSISWPDIPNQGIACFVSYGSFFSFSFVFRVYVLFCFLVFGCRYQRNWLPGKTNLWMNLPYYVSSGTLNPRCSPTHSRLYSIVPSLSCCSSTNVMHTFICHKHRTERQSNTLVQSTLVHVIASARKKF